MYNEKNWDKSLHVLLRLDLGIHLECFSLGESWCRAGRGMFSLPELGNQHPLQTSALLWTQREALAAILGVCPQRQTGSEPEAR